MLIAQREAQRLGLLALVLCQLIVGVRNLEPVARRENIQVERIASSRLEIDAIENHRGIADVVKRRELRRIEKAAGAAEIEHQEISPPRSANAESGIFSNRAEGAIVGLETEARPLAQSGARDGVDNQTGLSAEFRVRRSADEFKRLKRIGGKLRGKHFVLLIANDLLIDHIRGLAVIPLRMKEA